MGGHTKGRLRVQVRRPLGTDLHDILDEDGVTLAGMHGGNRASRKTNAARLVACWNACEGMADPEAEVGRMRAQMAEAIAILENGTDYEKMHVVEILRDGLGGSDV